jgi:hypothetical protein
LFYRILELYSKVDNLFLHKHAAKTYQKPIPVLDLSESKEHIKLANDNKNYDVVWILLREGATKDVDPENINFFEAIQVIVAR